MNAPEVLEAVQNVGGSLTLSGERIRYTLPDSAVWLVTELTQHREALIGLLREGGFSIDATGDSATEVGAKESAYRDHSHGDR